MIEHKPTPDFIDGMKIISEISSGGHAIVYKAWDSLLETYYAIKVMRPDADSADRFLTEAKVLAQIKHPNVPNVFSFGKIDGSPFIRMEYIDGEDLDSIIQKRQKIPLIAALSIIIQCARALQYAHKFAYEIYGEKRKGIIHRDIKPGNILVGLDGVVKIVDFGIVKVENLSMHATGNAIIGTPYYMSPEQLDPPDSGEPLDHRSDIYSLGCVLFECLTGECQFDADTLTMVYQRKKISMYSESKIKEFPKSLRKIIKTATAADRVARYADIDKMIAEMEILIKHANAGKPEVETKKYLEGEGSGKGDIKSISRRLIKDWVLIVPLIIVFIAVGFLIYRSEQRKKINIADSSSRGENQVSKPIPKSDLSAGKASEIVPVQTNKRHTIFKKTINNLSKSVPLSAFDLFHAGRYSEVVQTLSDKNPRDLSDSLFLALCGSVIVQNPEKAAELLFSRSIHDGYLEYLRGRYYCEKGNFEIARNTLLKAFTIPSIIACDEPALYYLVKSSAGLYREKPNIGNREFYTGQLKEYIDKYCDKTNESDHCRVVQNMQ